MTDSELKDKVAYWKNEEAKRRHEMGRFSEAVTEVRDDMDAVPLASQGAQFASFTDKLTKALDAAPAQGTVTGEAQPLITPAMAMATKDVMLCGVDIPPPSPVGIAPADVAKVTDDFYAGELTRTRINRFVEKLYALIAAAGEQGPIDPEALAKFFHETYERLAPEHSYKTREASATCWSEVPENNRTLMVAVAKEVISRLPIAAGEQVPVRNQQYEMTCPHCSNEITFFYETSCSSWGVMVTIGYDQGPMVPVAKFIRWLDTLEWCYDNPHYSKGEDDPPLCKDAECPCSDCIECCWNHIHFLLKPHRAAPPAAEPDEPDDGCYDPAPPKGLYNKFTVTRNDGRSAPGEKHHDCEYFVLDLTHDKYARKAIRVYAQACIREYPELAADLREKYESADTPAPPTTEQRAACPECAKREAEKAQLKITQLCVGLLGKIMSGNYTDEELQLYEKLSAIEDVLDAQADGKERGE